MISGRKNLIIVIALTAFVVLGFVMYDVGLDELSGMQLFIFLLIAISAIAAIFMALKKDKEYRQGLTIEDEMSRLLKYKAGYYAFLASMYMWLFIFLFKDMFPDVESMLGGGVLLSAVLAMIIKVVIKRNFNA